MSIQTIQNNIARLQRDVSDLQRKLSDETKQEAEKHKRISQVQNDISRSTSMTTLQSKQRELIRLSEDLSRIQAKQADINKNIASKREQLHRYELDLLKEREREQKKVEEAEKRRERERLDHQRAVTRELTTQKYLSHDLSPTRSFNIATQVISKKYDFFISHASEDKEIFARPLAEALERRGTVVWYDEFQLKVGDSLRRSIDLGLANSRFGIVVLSGSFFAKNWPQYELDGLVAREMEGAKVVLPIWHKVSKDEVMSYSPSLADKIALNSSISSIEEIADELMNLVRS